MPQSAGVSIRVMGRDDIAFGTSLSEQAGWNQTEQDWHRVLGLSGEGCFLAEAAEGPVGTTAVIPFGDIAWIALVLVEQSQRGRGIGTALMRQALEYCDAHGFAAVRLDATTLGRPVYEKLGFRSLYEVVRFTGTLTPGAGNDEVIPLGEQELDAACKLDREVSGCDRSAFLRLLYAETPGSFLCVRRDGRHIGFVHARRGRLAVQLGPCVTSEREVGPALLERAASQFPGERFYVDIPRTNQPAIAWAEARRLAKERVLMRMEHGRPICDRPECLWAGSGPEKG